MNKSLYIYGLHTVLALLQKSPHRIQELLLQEARHDVRIQEIIHHAKQAHIVTHTTSLALLDEKTDNAVHQGVVARVTPPPHYSEHDLFKLLDELQEPPLLLILDGVQDPHNLGACLRSANAAGAHAVIVPKDKSASLTPIVHKVAAGAAEITPLIQVTNLARTLRDLKERGIWIYGASDSAEKNIYNHKLKGALAFVLGAEGKGLRRLTAEHCDFLAHIPMQGTVSSLNVSVATGICLFEAVRQRIGI
jgi:23S rRNA (guanosine2251-2'-O)-methyltransferase